MQVKWFRGVDHNTPIDQIKKMYLALVKEHHPDCGGSTEDMAEINAEWDYLKTHHYNIHTSASGSVYTDEKQDVPDWATAHYAYHGRGSSYGSGRRDGRSVGSGHAVRA